MSALSADPGDQARASVLVRVPADVAFRVFTEDLDRWWRRGLKYRVAGARSGLLHLEPRVGGRLFESFDTASGAQVFVTGEVLAWDPPSRLVFTWRATNFASDEKTEVEVTFEPIGSPGPPATRVTVTHRGWSRIRPDHPVRHGHDVRGFLRMKGLWWGELLSSLRTLVESG